AIIIGGSLAGLFAARVLADHYDEVVIIDRDEMPEIPRHRSGVPQSQHAHGLLARGQQIIEGHFPGIMASLVEQGAIQGDVDTVCIVTPAGKLASKPTGEEGVFVSRYLLEWTVRERLKQIPGVTLIEQTAVTRLLTNTDQSQVIGVETRPRKGKRPTEMRLADLVVDASGRRSRTPQWLVDLGYEAAPEEQINSGVGYLSRFYERPANFPADWEGLIVNARPPHNPRAGLILSIENDQWHVTLGNFAGHYPDTAQVTTDEGFLEYAATLSDPSLYEAIRVARPLTPVRAYRTPTNYLRHYEQLTRLPGHFIITGDAVCAFNPIYGQGMTTSAMDSVVLAEALRDHGPGWERRFQHQLAKTVSTPWFIATSEDLRWAGVRLTGTSIPPGTRLLRQYINALLRAARHDEVVAEAYTRLLNLLEQPSSLLRPSIVARVAAYNLRPRRTRADQGDAWALSPSMITMLRDRPTFN
ncbi:MAG: FAD-dependent monooxygenase, partial [Chloroflexota bacterium]